MYLEIKPNGAKWWRYRYYQSATSKDTMLSPAVSLADARKARLEAEQLLQAGIDPADCKRMEKTKRKQAVAEDWKAQYLEKKSPSHLERAWGMIGRCIFPYIGKRRLSD